MDALECPTMEGGYIMTMSYGYNFWSDMMYDFYCNFREKEETRETNCQNSNCAGVVNQI